MNASPSAPQGSRPRALAPLFRLDRRVDEFFAARRLRSLVRGCSVVTALGAGPLWILLYAAAWAALPRSTRGLLAPFLAAEGLGLAVLVPLRYLTRRSRPDPSYRPNRLSPWNRYSFPSHHSLRAFFLAALFGRLAPALRPALWALAVLIAASRVCLRRHHLSDVAAGALIGALVGGAVLLWGG
ncbi:MAG: hypothetical protein Kow0092_28400 [Deferrisomatales bacterium]